MANKTSPFIGLQNTHAIPIVNVENTMDNSRLVMANMKAEIADKKLPKNGI